MGLSLQLSRVVRVKQFGDTIASLSSFTADERWYSEDRVTRELLRDAFSIWNDIDEETIGAIDVSVFCPNSSRTCDARASRVAWLLAGASGASICAVNARLLHQRQHVGTYCPLASAVSIRLDREPTDALPSSGNLDGTIDVVAVRGDEIIVAQGRACSQLRQNVFSGTTARSLFGREMFRTTPDIKLESRALARASTLLRRFFPTHRIRCLIVLVHPLLDRPEFEIHEVDPQSDRLLTDLTLVSSCNDIRGAVTAAPDVVYCMPSRHDDDLLRHLPPDRGGRCTQLLAAMARRQLLANELVEFRKPRLSEIAQTEYGLNITQDKLRHDLDGRLSALQLLRPESGAYGLTSRGLAWYFYLLRKYSTAAFTLQDVLDQCLALELRHREYDIRLL